MESRFQAESVPADFRAELAFSDPPAASAAGAAFLRVVCRAGLFPGSVWTGEDGSELD